MAGKAGSAIITCVLVACAASACGSDGVTGPPYEPDIPTSWAAGVTNPYMPLIPGTVWEYIGETEDGTETIRVEVLAEMRMVNGFAATVVHDEVFLEGSLIEDTNDWYLQDLDGNVWYVGEDSKEVEDGVIVGTEGSWEWGVDDALPGVIMWADPGQHLNEDYRQEYYRGEAEDWGKVISTSQSVSVPFGDFDGCLETEDWNGLEGRSESLEFKYHCPGVGVVLEVPDGSPAERVELVDRTG